MGHPQCIYANEIKDVATFAVVVIRGELAER
jgi:hypothetical protein